MDPSTLTLPQLYEAYRENRAAIKTLQEEQLGIHREITRLEHGAAIEVTDKDQTVKG